MPDPITSPDYSFVINRSVRSHGNHCWWEWNLPNLKDKCVFVGLPKEHEIFEYTFGHAIRYLPTPDIMTLARVIAGCELFIGNASLPHALAEAMKKKLICEVDRVCPCTIFQRQGRGIRIIKRIYWRMPAR